MSGEYRKSNSSNDRISEIARLMAEEIRESTSYGLIVSITKDDPVEIEPWGSYSNEYST